MSLQDFNRRKERAAIYNEGYNEGYNDGYDAGYRKAIEEAARIAESNEREAFLYEQRDYDSNRPGSLDIPRNAYLIAGVIAKEIRRLANGAEGDGK